MLGPRSEILEKMKQQFIQNKIASYVTLANNEVNSAINKNSATFGQTK